MALMLDVGWQHTMAEMNLIVHEEFERWFTGIAGPPERYEDIAKEVNALIKRTVPDRGDR